MTGRPLSSDTRLEAERVQIALLRQTPAWRKLHMVAEMNRTVRILALTGLRQRFPNASPAELQQQLTILLLGAELAARVHSRGTR